MQKWLTGAFRTPVNSYLIPASLPCRGLQDELFNLTLDLVKVEAERTRAEAKLDGSIQRVQLDNQMLVCCLSSLPVPRCMACALQRCCNHFADVLLPSTTKPLPSTY